MDSERLEWFQTPGFVVTLSAARICLEKVIVSQGVEKLEVHYSTYIYPYLQPD
jgi:hypothetical protein